MIVPLEVDCRQVKSRLDERQSFLFLDCRERDEYETAHVASTTLIPMSELAEWENWNHIATRPLSCIAITVEEVCGSRTGCDNRDFRKFRTWPAGSMSGLSR